MRSSPLESLAILNSADGGALTYYVMHLWQHMARFANPVYLTYAHERIDQRALEQIPQIKALVDPAAEGNIREVLRFLRQRRIRLVNVQVCSRLLRNLPYFLELGRALRAHRIGLLATLHNVLPHDYFPVCMSDLRCLYSLADGFLVGNRAERERLSRHFVVADRPVAIAPLGPWTLLDRGLHTDAEARRLLGLPQTGRIVLFFGYLRPEKNLEALLRVWPRLRARIPDALLLIRASDRHYRGDKTLLPAPMIHDGSSGLDVRTDFIPSAEIELLLKAADLVVLPYRRVTQSSVLSTALAFARPVIVTDVFEGAQEIHRTCGRAVPVDDDAALEAALAELLAKKPGELRRLGLDGQHWALGKQHWQENAAALERTCGQIRAGWATAGKAMVPCASPV
jgi:glycosyltransferase involved in cell wall biosynthesis